MKSQINQLFRNPDCPRGVCEASRAERIGAGVHQKVQVNGAWLRRRGVMSPFDPIRERFGDHRGRDGFMLLEVGDGPGDAKHASRCSRRKAELINGSAEQMKGLPVGCTVLFKGVV